MKTSIHRLLKACCTVAVAVTLVACGGATSTVNPFQPTRVIGLGDWHNNENTTLTVTGTTDGLRTTVAGQVAALFGSGLTWDSSQASDAARATDLPTQINHYSSFSATDLVVITVGTNDFVANVPAATFLNDLKQALDLLRSKGATHILVMSVVDISFGTHYTSPAAFNGTVSGGLGSYTDIVRYTNIDAPSTGVFSAWPNAYCDTPAVLDGCTLTGQTNAAANVTTYFLADNLHTTPAGNRWIGQYLYNVTAQGWR